MAKVNPVTRYGYITRDGNVTDLYLAGQGLILVYPKVYTIVYSKYDGSQDVTRIKYDRKGRYND